MPSSSQPILVISELFAPTKGGTAVWFDQVYRRLGGKNIQILAASTEGDSDVDLQHPNSIHRITMKRIRWLRPESLAIYIRLFVAGFKISWKNKPIQFHAGRVLPEGLIAWLLSRIYFKPCLIYAHGEEITTWRTPIKRRLMEFLYRHADVVIANSEFTKGKLIQLGVSKSRIRMIHPGVMTQIYHKSESDEIRQIRKDLLGNTNDFLLLSVGRLSRRKGFDTMLSVVKKLRDDDVAVHYAVAGIGEDFNHLKDIIDNEGLSDSVTLLGAIEDDALPKLYNACDLFVMPNREVNGDVEGFGMVYIEAAACGKTAISGISGGVVSAVLHEVTGVNCNGNSIDEIYSATYRLLTQQDDREQLAQAAHKRAHSEFSWESVALRTREIFSSSLKSYDINDYQKDRS
ncbi:glycosyltransferase family 4 protein [Aestuariirhabdus sp. Z084]|uniref:glycosyltransferase family 4 protein n=1 Tax=Aestuariirhabdus haliotis TaxID=2918751 RepID=UPI00201B3659|nr:glycosyltransferase family 4 protein [Aestuariirhabdus haliotis]MCL6414693.1 glycosyltransferase family 4 protein [Aestuariirhabdus haliotis]MCL6418625.1 glycosyltransferase family 4 protein [Aestuariirhabdus haliotis]